MLKFLSKVRIEFNALDPRLAGCMEFLAQCNATKAKESNPACQVEVKRRTDDYPPKITVTFVNGVEEVFDATATSAQTIRTMILDKGTYLETEQMFRDAGEKWPVLIPEREISEYAAGTKGERERCIEFLAQCNATTAKELNPACHVEVTPHRRTWWKTGLHVSNGVEVFDATATSAQTIRTMILDKGTYLETEQGENWPVLISKGEVNEYSPGTKPRKAEEKKQ